eukprot:TRINITY_DN3170_c7_g1_i1.p1 TRINITY_DN3170_c7_g1~~TRINITY_DN3170_c7_g1_i1.p1  ORF type:complete len:506 (-),score=114.77 TRINITY_DN3170_c7_g1_i1:279-1796(-)
MAEAEAEATPAAAPDMEELANAVQIATSSEAAPAPAPAPAPAAEEENPSTADANDDAADKQLAKVDDEASGKLECLERDVNEFISEHGIDERAAADLRSCPAEVQRKVLGRGGLSSARNPSAAILVRIKDARADLIKATAGTAGPNMGLPSSREIEAFCKENGVNEKATKALRSSSPMVKRRILQSTHIKGSPDPSAALMAMIPDKKKGGSGAAANMGLARSWGLVPSAADVDTFLKNNEVDERAATDLRTASARVQQAVLAQGDLKSARNASSALIGRIRDAKLELQRGESGRDEADGDKKPPLAYPPPGAYPPMIPGYPPPGYPGGPPPGYYGYPPPGMYPPPGYPGYPGYPPYGAPPGAYMHGAPPPHGGVPQPGRSRSGSYTYSYSYSYTPSRGGSPPAPAGRRAAAVSCSRSRSQSCSGSGSRSRSRTPPPQPKKKKKRRGREATRDDGGKKSGKRAARGGRSRGRAERAAPEKRSRREEKTRRNGGSEREKRKAGRGRR